jgi:hypothetical protein
MQMNTQEIGHARQQLITHIEGMRRSLTKKGIHHLEFRTKKEIYTKSFNRTWFINKMCRLGYQIKFVTYGPYYLDIQLSWASL